MPPSMRFVAAAAAALAIAPSSALAQSSHQHDLNIDKSEQFMELQGMQSKTATLSCPTGQIAVNGSVKVDAVDNPGHPQFVDTLTSRGFGPRSWRFVIVNNNQSGRAQVKLFIVCMAGTAGPHSVTLSEPGNDPATTVPETDATWDNQGSIGSGFFNDRNPGCPGTSPGIGVYPDPTLFPVRPSFAFRPSAGEMYTSDALLFSASGATSTFGVQSRDWTFQFDTYGNDIATNAMTSIRCLGTHVSSSSGHQHAYDVSYQRVPHNVTVAPGTRAYDINVGCPKRNGTFGIIGVHSEFGGGRVTGSEPRGDVWAFRLANRGANPSVFQLGVICVEKRVWHSNGAVPPPAPVPQTVDTTVTTERVGIDAGDTQTFTVTCADKVRFALSGSMSIDRVSAGDIGVFEDISLTESRAVGLNKWRFTIENGAAGGANVSLRLVCLAPWTEGHAMVLSGVETSNVQAGDDTCAGNGQFPVQAGYSGAEASRMAPGRGSGSTVKPTWGFGFRGGKAKTSLACLYDQTTIRSNHYHQTYATVASKTATLPAGQAKTILVKCKKNEVAVAGGLDASGTSTRVVQSTPKGRSWRFQLVSLAKKAKVTGYATCLGKKTSGELFT